ncbi:unnamed protein product [Rotaria socialis]|uniref:Proteasome activator Blm10 middle HEAT repeats region domain-containing protein n=1 Tax=Rotaria socialis TaxID=392032 RepID=A0A818F410_9BILA|nr:unnamed protein product [Rotaria socialis]
MDDSTLQKPNVYNRYLPFYDSIQRQAYAEFDEIRMHLSRIIQLREIRPGFSVWSSKLQQFISLYGYHFTKSDHLKLIDFYLSILSADNLSLIDVRICFNLLEVLLNGIEQSFFNCIRCCRFYFSATATQEILDEFRPWLCPFDSAFGDAMYFFDWFLPVNLPPNLHNQGFKESKADRIWQFKPLQSYRLTEQDITDFVNCAEEYVFISIFNKTYQEDAAKAFRHLAMLRPELVVPAIVEQLFSSVNSINEPHRFTSSLSCLTGITRQIVQQTLNFPQGQTYVLPLLISVLSGIDSNDFDKTSKTFQFLKAILMLITCVDCSSAINIPNDLTEVEKEVCLLTAQFEDFIIEFLNRTFQMVDSLSTEVFDGWVATTANDVNTEIELTPVIPGIIEQCSSKIFQVVQEKIINFLAASSFTPRVSKLLTDLVQPILEANPIETLKYIMPQTCERIEKIMHDSEATILTDHKGDMELTWCLILFSKLLQARGDTLLVYKSMISSVFHRCIHIIHKKSYEAIANAAKNLLKSFSYVYPIDYRLTVENIDGPFSDFLPIRVSLFCFQKEKVTISSGMGSTCGI